LEGFVDVKIKPAAVVGSQTREPGEQQQHGPRWQRFWQAVDRIRERNADKDPDAVLHDVTAVVEEVRQEHYERARRETPGHR
jgi:hypothetical protein